MLKRNMECWQFLADSDRKESQIFRGKLGLEVTSLWNRVMFWASS